MLDYWLTRLPRLYLRIEELREWQNWDKRVYLSLIEDGHTVLDIGANVGAHTVAFSHIVGNRGRVISFEPVPGNFERLQETVKRRCRHPNTALFRLALSSPESVGQEASIKVPGNDFTQASLRAHATGSWNSSTIQGYSCPVSSVDAELEGLGLARVDFMKIDVEGGELDVISGSLNTLLTFRPLVYCEMYEKWTAGFGYTPSELFSRLCGAGYVEARVIRDGRVHRRRLDERVPHGLFDGSADVLFSRPEHAGRLAGFDCRYG